MVKGERDISEFLSLTAVGERNHDYEAEEFEEKDPAT
jgi:hypothetical protein